ncbi:MAG: hypothetical protein KF842_14590 [Caulobacter sp.]|nr:hypothetical protein [Caulobacter sp.]
MPSQTSAAATGRRPSAGMVRSIVAASVAALLMAGPVLAAPDTSAFKAANQRVAQAINANRADLPMLSDPKMAPTLRLAFDQQVLPLLPLGDPMAALQDCSPAFQAMQAYALGASANLSPSEQALAAGRNAIRYHDEQSLIFAFAISCMARALPAAETFWTGLAPEQRTEVRREGLNKMRSGLTEIYGGALSMIGETPYTLANKAAILESLVRSGETFARVMTLDQRRQTVSRIDALAPSSDQTLKPRLARLRAIMSDRTCTDLCLV